MRKMAADMSWFVRDPESRRGDELGTDKPKLLISFDGLAGRSPLTRGYKVSWKELTFNPDFNLVGTVLFTTFASD